MIYQVLRIVGSLGLFLFGMRTMSDGIQKAAGERLQSILNFMTGNRIAAIFTGFAITAIIQSSSATTVMVVSFVNAGLLQLTQAIGVIMGANIGTTITGWIVAIFGFKMDISLLALPAIGIGFVLMMIKKLNKKDWGEACIGFGLLFLGLDFLKNSVPDINSHPEALAALTRFTGHGLLSYFFFILVGTLVTIIMQSSSATMAITLTMAYAGWIDYPTAAALVLGENIGTTITAYLASLGMNVNARRASRAHTLFNVFGVLWMTVVFTPFLQLVDIIVPGDVYALNNAVFLPDHLAMFHTLFNVANTVLCSFFVKQIAHVVQFLVPEEKEEAYRLQYVSATLQDTPELYMVTVKRELSKMADIVSDMFHRFWETFSHPEKRLAEAVDKQKEMEDLTDKMQEEITKFLSQCSLDKMNRVSGTNVSNMMRIAHELEGIGDNCFNLIILAERRAKQKLLINEVEMEELQPYIDLVNRFLQFIRSHLNEHITSENMTVAVKLEESINTMRNTLRQSAANRLQNGEDVRKELLYIDIVRHIEQIGDHCLNITESLRQTS